MVVYFRATTQESIPMPEYVVYKSKDIATICIFSGAHQGAPPHPGVGKTLLPKKWRMSLSLIQ